MEKRMPQAQAPVSDSFDHRRHLWIALPVNPHTVLQAEIVWALLRAITIL